MLFREMQVQLRIYGGTTSRTQRRQFVLSPSTASLPIMMLYIEEALQVATDMENKARIQGVAAQMTTFTYLFGSMLGELVLKHTDNLSKTFQHVSMSAAEGQQITVMTVATLNSMCSDDQFEIFWDLVTHKAEELGVSEPQLPRQRKLPRRYDYGSASGCFPSTPKTHFKPAYFEAIDLITNCVQQRFDQPGYWIYRSLETLLIKASKREEFQENLDDVCAFYHDDFDQQLLHSQLQTLYISKWSENQQYRHLSSM